jgi:hypothetical protein
VRLANSRDALRTISEHSTNDLVPCFSELVKLAALIVVVPLVLIIAHGWQAAILPIIIYLQLLLIWVQAKISLRQTALFAAQFEPAFDVKFADAARTILTIENVSENPAYNLDVGRLLDQRRAPIDPKHGRINWTSTIWRR